MLEQLRFPNAACLQDATLKMRGVFVDPGVVRPLANFFDPFGIVKASLLLHDHKRLRAQTARFIAQFDLMPARLEDGEGVSAFHVKFERRTVPARLIRASGLQQQTVAAVADVGIEDDDGAGDGIGDAKLRACIRFGDCDEIAEPVGAGGNPRGVFTRQDGTATGVVIAGLGHRRHLFGDEELLAAQT